MSGRKRNMFEGLGAWKSRMVSISGWLEGKTGGCKGTGVRDEAGQVEWTWILKDLV